MLDISDIRPGMRIELDGAPYEVLYYEFSKKQRQKPVARTRIRNLASGATLEHTFQPGDKIREAELEKRSAVFIYVNRGEYWFHAAGNPKDRFPLSETIAGNVAQYLKGQSEVELLVWNGTVIGITIPIKVDLAVVDAPPGLRGNTSQGGTKLVTLETGLKVMTPLFVDVGDVVRINTDTGAYVERVKKS